MRASSPKLPPSPIVSTFSPFTKTCKMQRLENPRVKNPVDRKSGRQPHLNFAGVDDVKVVALVALVNDDLAGDGVDWEHRVEDVHPLVLVEVRKEDVLSGRLGQGIHCARVFRHDLKKIGISRLQVKSRTRRA